MVPRLGRKLLINMSKLSKILSKILGVNEGEITNESSPDNIPSWDSFNGLMLVSELEDTYKINFTVDEVMNVKKVKDIKKALIDHGVKSDEI